MANRVTMTICGTEYILVAEEDAAYMETIGSMVDTEMRSRAKSEAAELRRKLQNAQNQNNRRG